MKRYPSMFQLELEWMSREIAELRRLMDDAAELNRNAASVKSAVFQYWRDLPKKAHVFRVWRVLSKTAHYKRELMERACHPNRLAQI